MLTWSPIRKRFLPPYGKLLRESGWRHIARLRVSGRDHAALAGVDPAELDIAYTKRLWLAIDSKQPVLPERFNTINLNVGPKALANLLNGQSFKPTSYRFKRGSTDDRWAGGTQVIWKPRHVILNDRDFQ